MSAAGRALSKALDIPKDWSIPDKYQIIHKPTDMSFWIANGSFFFDGNDIDGTPPCLGLIERHWLYFKAMRALRDRTSKHMKSQQRLRNQAVVAGKFARSKE